LKDKEKKLEHQAERKACEVSQPIESFDVPNGLVGETFHVCRTGFFVFEFFCSTVGVFNEGTSLIRKWGKRVC
jgi:hypothetical protein